LVVVLRAGEKSRHLGMTTKRKAKTKSDETKTDENQGERDPKTTKLKNGETQERRNPRTTKPKNDETQDPPATAAGGAPTENPRSTARNHLANRRDG
jgi:hypothetical protein